MIKYYNGLMKLYNSDESKIQRFEDLLISFNKHFGETDNYELFSSAGRTEIIGNHTDHNFGKVACASIDLDTIAVAAKTNTDIIRIVSIDYNQDFSIDINKLEVSPEDNWTCVLVKGMLSYLSKIGKIGGFNACITSNVISSAGLSSSASFEMLISTIINSFFNNNELKLIDLAKAGQYAENTNWNKKSGLLDQIACANGGMIAIDFKNINEPVISKIEATDFINKYDLIIVPTGGGHSDLSEEYSAIPNEMKSIAGTELSNINKNYIVENFNKLREKVGDRAILRAIHFFDENMRVDKLIRALDCRDYTKVIKIIEESGDSSWKLLQNCYLPVEPKYQPIPVMLSMTKYYLDHNGVMGTTRVHGGGFAGVIITILPKSESDEYIKFISDDVENRPHKLSIRPYGALNIKDID